MKTIISLESKPHSFCIENPCSGSGNFIRQNPGAERYGHVEIILEPDDTDTFSVWFSWEVSEDVIPTCNSLLRGAVVRVVGGSYHEVDSNPMAYFLQAIWR